MDVEAVRYTWDSTTAEPVAVWIGRGAALLEDEGGGERRRGGDGGDNVGVRVRVVRP
jgi:hypothetical protein